MTSSSVVMSEVMLSLALIGLLLCLQRVSGLKIEFDEPATKSVHLGSRTSLRCLVTDEKDLRWMMNSVQIVRSQHEQQTVLSKRGTIYESESHYYRVTKLNINQTNPHKLELVFDILSVRTVDNAEFKCRVVDHTGKVQAEGTVKLQIVSSPRIDSFTANKRREFLEVSPDTDIEFKCLASGTPTVYLSLLKSTPDGRDELVHISRHRNKLEYEIDDADCRHGGVYRCQIDKNPRSAKRIKVAVTKCVSGGSGERGSDKSPSSKHLTVKVAVPCVCVAVVAFAIVGIVHYIKRRKVRKSKSTNQRAGIKMKENVYSTIKVSRSLSPPPYSICQNVGDMDVPPPMYPGEGAAIDQSKVELTATSSGSDHSRTDHSKTDPGHYEARIDDLPPPYPFT